MDFSNRNVPQKVSGALPRGFFIVQKILLRFFLYTKQRLWVYNDYG